MLFNSYVFIFVFLPMTLAVYYYAGKRGNIGYPVAALGAASLVFYSWWDYRYVSLLLISIAFNFFVGRGIEKLRGKALIVAGVAGNLALLGYFKYANFFIDSINAALGADIELTKIALPLGISFFTFTQIAYLVDAHRGETKGYGFREYLLFVTLFPHLIAGPILYHKSMVSQFRDPRVFMFSWESMSKGTALFAMGLFKKTIIADNLAPLAAFAFNAPGEMTTLDAWQGALAYTFQLYFDFSAYSEMAIGLGLMLNMKLPVNFDSPYKSKSIIEFWRRWHMTLSFFLKNYLYIPLGGNRRGELRKMVNIFITMLLGGLWHGAGWTFVFWGGLHGVYLVANHSFRKLSIKSPAAISWALTFFCVVVAWVFFRSSSMSDAFSMIASMAGANGLVLPYEFFGRFDFIPSAYVGELRFGLKGLLFVAFCGALCMLPNPTRLIEKFMPDARWAFATIILLAASLFSFNKVSEFLYFQF
ncbi:MAG TPA: MBOAT family O-acyltransferase [bacterium]|nr:MBOAT family O-acyltransferase [bacterium]